MSTEIMRNVPTGTQSTLAVSTGGVTVSEQFTWGGTQGGGTGSATMTISARRGQQQIAPEGIAFFAEVSGFDSVKPAEGQVYDPTLHDISYTWTFGDLGEYAVPQTMLPEWRNKNVGYGPFPCHCYTKPGVYVVTCIAVEKSSGKTATASMIVGVQDPEAIFTAATTIVCAQNGNFSGAPAHDVANRTTTFDAALARLRALKANGQPCRVLFRAGDVFSMTVNTHLSSAYRNIYISSFGSGRATVKATMHGDIFGLYASMGTSGASISRIAMTGPWDSTTETVDPAFTSSQRPVGANIYGGFATVHDCTGTGLDVNFKVGSDPGVTAIFSECQATNWEDYGSYVSGDTGSGYAGLIGCRLAQDPNALQGGNYKTDSNLGNRHGSIRLHACHYIYIDALDGFSRNGWTVIGTDPNTAVPADQNVIRDHRNHPNSFAFFSRIMGEGGWQLYSSGSASTSAQEKAAGRGRHLPCNAVIDKAYFLGSARTINFIELFNSAFTGRNMILHRPNVGTGKDGFGKSILMGDPNPDNSSASNRTEPLRFYNITVINELDDVQQARSDSGLTGWSPYIINQAAYEPGAVQIENLVVHRPNFTGGFVADAPLDNTRLGFTPRYLGYRWKEHWDAGGAQKTVNKLTMDTSFATPPNPWSLWRPLAGSPAIGSAAGLVAYDDLLGNIRPPQASRGAIEPLTGPTVTGKMWVGAFDSASTTATIVQVDGADSVRLAAIPMGGGATITSPAVAVDPSYRFARATLTGQTAGTEYTLRWQTPEGVSIGEPGWVKTRPTTRQPFKLGFASCGERFRNHLIYETIWQQNPDMLAFLHLGDRGYFDLNSNNVANFHGRDNNIFDQSRQAAFHRRPVIYIWDDHDYGNDNATALSAVRPAALNWYRNRVPSRPHLTGIGDPVYYSWSPAPGVEIALLDIRADQYAADAIIGPAQEAWLIGKIQALGPTDILGIGTIIPWIGSAAGTWGAAAALRTRIANAITTYAPGRVFALAGDMHALAFDSGVNSAGGIPVFHAAPLGRSTSTKGGPYSSGTPVRATEQQYGTLEFVPVTGGWSVAFKGWSVDDFGAQTQRLTHTATLVAA